MLIFATALLAWLNISWLSKLPWLRRRAILFGVVITAALTGLHLAFLSIFDYELWQTFWPFYFIACLVPDC